MTNENQFCECGSVRDLHPIIMGCQKFKPQNNHSLQDKTLNRKDDVGANAVKSNESAPHGDKTADTFNLR